MGFKRENIKPHDIFEINPGYSIKMNEIISIFLKKKYFFNTRINNQYIKGHLYYFSTKKTKGG